MNRTVFSTGLVVGLTAFAAGEVEILEFLKKDATTRPAGGFAIVPYVFPDGPEGHGVVMSNGSSNAVTTTISLLPPAAPVTMSDLGGVPGVLVTVEGA